MNVFLVKSGEVPFREYAFPEAEGKAAALLLTVMQRNGRPATMATVQGCVIAVSVAQGHRAPDGWDVITAQQE